MKKISDLIIMSDVDGTLLHANHSPVPSRGNIEALERFVAKGGRFAISTGRSLRYIQHLIDVTPVNFPCIVFNGGGVYDFQKQEYLYKQLFPQEAAQYVKEIHEAFPDCGAVLVDENAYMDIGGTVKEKLEPLYKNLLLQPAGFDDMKDPLMKAFFIADAERGKQIYEYTQQTKFSGVRFVFSDKYMLEMLPEGASKGAAIEQLVKLTGTPIENFVAIGDYYNDFEMIECAGIGVTLSDAPQDIQDIAQMIVRPCSEDSLADLIEQLEELYA